MRLTTFVVLALAAASHAAAQTQSRAQLALTILGGAVTGHSLWDVPIQPFAVLDNTNGQPTGVDDTLHLRRDISSSIVVGVSATYFFSPHVGVHAEISYLGLPFDDGCTGVFHPDTEQKNEQICNDIQSHSAGGGAVSLYLGATLRTATPRALSPYVRGSIGIVGLPHSSVGMLGGYLTSQGVQPPLAVIDDRSPRHSAPLFGLAVGLTTPVGKGGGYQFRLEARDLITSLERVTGQANASGIAPTATRYYHHFALTLGFDVVLERARGRRY